MAANHSRQQRHHARLAVHSDGVILALDDEFYLDQGAYVRAHGARVPEMTIAMLPGPYWIPAYRAVGHFRLTNKTPAATYRAPGRYEGTFVRERLVDAVADQLGLDRVTVRRRNLITAAEMPFSRPLNALGTEVVYDSGDYKLLLDKALAQIGWDDWTCQSRVALSVILTRQKPDPGWHHRQPGNGNARVSPEGATLGVPAMTAHRAVFVAGPVQGNQR